MIFNEFNSSGTLQIVVYFINYSHMNAYCLLSEWKLSEYFRSVNSMNQYTFDARDGIR